MPLLPLLLFVGKNRRAVLRADIVALTIERRRIVGREEYCKQSRKARSGVRIELNLDHFGMTRAAAANLFVGGFLCAAAGIAETTEITPRNSSKTASMHQKQPPPKTATFSPLLILPRFLIKLRAA